MVVKQYDALNDLKNFDFAVISGGAGIIHSCINATLPMLCISLHLDQFYWG